MGAPSDGLHSVITIVGTVGTWTTESHQLNVSVSIRNGIKFYGVRQGSTSVDFEIQVYKNADNSSDVVLRLGAFCRYNLVVFSDSSDISIAGTTGVTTGTLQSETMKNSANVIFLGNGSVVQNSTYATKIGSNSSHPSTGSTSIPVYVDTNGQVQACTDDFVHDADVAKMVQVAAARTAVGSSLQPVYVNSSGVAAVIGYKTWMNDRSDSLSAMNPMWYATSGSMNTPTDGDNLRYVELAVPIGAASFDLDVYAFVQNSPFVIRIQFSNFTHGSPGIVIKNRVGYAGNRIYRVITRWNLSEFKVYFELDKTVTAFSWRSNHTLLTNTMFSLLSKAQYDALTSTVRAQVSLVTAGAISTSGRNKQRGEYDIIDAGDLATTTDAGIVKFMTTNEATAIWDRAWAAATPS